MSRRRESPHLCLKYSPTLFSRDTHQGRFDPGVTLRGRLDPSVTLRGRQLSPDRTQKILRVHWDTQLSFSNYSTQTIARDSQRLHILKALDALTVVSKKVTLSPIGALSDSSWHMWLRFGSQTFPKETQQSFRQSKPLSYAMTASHYYLTYIKKLLCCLFTTLLAFSAVSISFNPLYSITSLTPNSNLRIRQEQQ